MPTRARRVLAGALVAGTLSVGGFLGGRVVEANRTDVAEVREARAEAACLARADDLRRELVADRGPSRSYLAARYAELGRQIERAEAGDGDVGYLAAAMAREGYEQANVIPMSCTDAARQ